MLWHQVHFSGIWLNQYSLTRHPIGCLVWKETPLSARLVDLLWPLEPVGRDVFQHSRPTRKQIPHPVPSLWQIPDPVNIFSDPRSVFWSNPESRKYPSRPWKHNKWNIIVIISILGELPEYEKVQPKSGVSEVFAPDKAYVTNNSVLPFK